VGNVKVTGEESLRCICVSSGWRRGWVYVGLDKDTGVDDRDGGDDNVGDDANIGDEDGDGHNIAFGVVRDGDNVGLGVVEDGSNTGIGDVDCCGNIIIDGGDEDIKFANCCGGMLAFVSKSAVKPSVPVLDSEAVDDMGMGTDTAREPSSINKPNMAQTLLYCV
jgi:hypothetical protein